MTEFGKRVALITGCGKQNGIGAAIAQRLAGDGFIVVVSDVAAAGVDNDHTLERTGSGWQGLDTLVAWIEAAGGEALGLTGDVSAEDGAAHLVAKTIEAYGRLDVLVNNAGAPHGQDRNQIEAVPLSAWEAVMAVNVRGVFLMTRAAVPHMKARGYGRIVSMSSVAGLAALPERAAYCASKAAVIGMTRSLAYDLAPHGITVNCICPGSIRTDRAISSTLRAGWTDVDAGLAERAKAIPVGRHGPSGGDRRDRCPPGLRGRGLHHRAGDPGRRWRPPAKRLLKRPGEAARAGNGAIPEVPSLGLGSQVRCLFRLRMV